MQIKLTLTEEMLGTKASDPEIFATFIASKAPDGDKRKEELDNAENREQSGTTIFHTCSTMPGNNGLPVIGIYNYQIKGFFKDACGAMNRFDKALRGGLDKLAAYKTKIDSGIFIAPRFIELRLPEGKTCGICERPLRAETAQGPRVSLCRSQTVPIGTTLEFTITILINDLTPYIHQWLDYGKLRGLGQWRNSGKGIFEWQEIKE
jgi:hypothetical protein